MGSCSSQKKYSLNNQGPYLVRGPCFIAHNTTSPPSSIRALDRDLLALLLEGWQLSDRSLRTQQLHLGKSPWKDPLVWFVENPMGKSHENPMENPWKSILPLGFWWIFMGKNRGSVVLCPKECKNKAEDDHPLFESKDIQRGTRFVTPERESNSQQWFCSAL